MFNGLTFFAGSLSLATKIRTDACVQRYTATAFFPSPNLFRNMTRCFSASGSISGDDDGRLYERIMGLPVLRAAG